VKAVQRFSRGESGQLNLGYLFKFNFDLLPATLATFYQTCPEIAVNLFDTRESNLTPAEQIEIGHEEVQAKQGEQAARQELWKWLLLGAIGVLIFEWYVYNRRVYL